MGQDKFDSSEAELDQGPSSAELIQAYADSVLDQAKGTNNERSARKDESERLDEGEGGVDKMGLLSTVKLVKDTANLAEDMVASGSLMNVFIQVAPDGQPGRDLKKVLEEVEAQG